MTVEEIHEVGKQIRHAIVGPLADRTNAIGVFGPHQFRAAQRGPVLAGREDGPAFVPMRKRLVIGVDKDRGDVSGGQLRYPQFRVSVVHRRIEQFAREVFAFHDRRIHAVDVQPVDRPLHIALKKHLQQTAVIRFAFQLFDVQIFMLFDRLSHEPMPISVHRQTRLSDSPIPQVVLSVPVHQGRHALFQNLNIAATVFQPRRVRSQPTGHRPLLITDRFAQHVQRQPPIVQRVGEDDLTPGLTETGGKRRWIVADKQPVESSRFVRLKNAGIEVYLVDAETEFSVCQPFEETNHGKVESQVVGETPQG